MKQWNWTNFHRHKCWQFIYKIGINQQDWTLCLLMDPLSTEAFCHCRYFDPGRAHIGSGQLHGSQPGDHAVPPGPGEPSGPAVRPPAPLGHLPALRPGRPDVIGFGCLLRRCSWHGVLLHRPGIPLPTVLQPLWLLWWVCV